MVFGNYFSNPLFSFYRYLFRDCKCAVIEIIFLTVFHRTPLPLSHAELYVLKGEWNYSS